MSTSAPVLPVLAPRRALTPAKWSARLAAFDCGGHSDPKVLTAASLAQGRDAGAEAERLVVLILTRCWSAVTGLALKLFSDNEIYNADVLAALGLSLESGVRALELANFIAGAQLGSFTVSTAAG
jgi:hypothetical protein